MSNRSGIIIFAVILGFILLPVFMWISEYVFELFMPNGQNFVLYKAVIGLLYAGYIFVVRKFILKMNKEKVEIKPGE